MTLKALQRDPATFRNRLRIDCDGRVVALDSVMDPWQERDFRALDASWQRVAGNTVPESPTRAWLERPRGHSKTGDIATMVSWALFASRRAIKGVAAAADRDQAQLIRDAILTLCRLNPWLDQLLDVQQWKVVNKHTGSQLDIISSDASTSYGLLPDFVVADEITHWKNRELWDSLFSSAAKKASCLLLVITNAGFQQDWQFDVRQAVQGDENWYFARLDGPCASWITEDRLAEQERLLPHIAFRRLWLNVWSSGTGDALDSEDVDKSINLVASTDDAEKGWVYVAGLDLGLSRDASALVVLGKHVGYSEAFEKKPFLTERERILLEAGLLAEPDVELIETGSPGTGRIRLCQCRVWRPTQGRRVDVEAIEKSIKRLDERFQFSAVAYDPWQANYLGERLLKAEIPAEQVPFSANNLRGMCSTLLEAFRERNIDLYRDGNLISDLRNLRIVEKSYGVRLDSPRGPAGHGDAATALSLALYAAKDITTGTLDTVDGPLLVSS